MLTLTPLNGVEQDDVPLSAVRTSMASSMHSSETPLGNIFFRQDNINRVQKMLREAFKKETGIAIDKQNPRDVLSFMRYIYINNSMNPYANIESQVNDMNKRSVDKMLPQIREGVSAYIFYLRDASTLSQPEKKPVNTSTKGMKMGKNNKVGI
jgi:hypothetical protein